MLKEGAAPGDWLNSVIGIVYQWKDNALQHGRYGGLKLLDQTMKGAERIG